MKDWIKNFFKKSNLMFPWALVIFLLTFGLFKQKRVQFCNNKCEKYTFCIWCKGFEPTTSWSQVSSNNVCEDIRNICNEWIWCVSQVNYNNHNNRTVPRRFLQMSSSIGIVWISPWRWSHGLSNIKDFLVHLPKYYQT